MVDQSEPGQRHHMFYYPDGTHIFRVQDTLFKVHKSVLSDKSLTFKTMFDASDHAGVPPIDGFTDDKAILIPEQVTDTAFELFLSVCYNKWRPDAWKAPEPIIVELLELSRMYESQDVRTYAIKRLSTCCYTMKAVNLVSISLKYQIKETFRRAFRRLIFVQVNDMKNSELASLSFTVWVALIRVRERLDLHRRIVACEPPALVHSAGCVDHQGCFTDWRQLWWNGMGRFLMDGRNPQTYDAAIQQFQGLGHGGMTPECWRRVIAFVKEGKAFLHEDDLIDRTAQGLAEILISEPSFDDAFSL